MSVKITTLIENTKDEKSSLISEHGLAFFIEADNLKIIFDTGQSNDFMKNADNLGIDIREADYVILSHGHYDHTGGFISLIKKIKNSAAIILNKNLFNDKYSYKDGDYKYTGNSFNKKFLADNNLNIIYINEDIHKLTENLFIFSSFKKEAHFETINKKFYIKLGRDFQQDLFEDEIVLGIKTQKGLVIILGCSHVGVVNILETISERTGFDIYGVIGGTHLVEADEERIDNTIEYFKKRDIGLIGVSHCTGEEAIEKLQCEVKDRFIYNDTGNIIEII